jgi:hypothetical protein
VALNELKRFRTHPPVGLLRSLDGTLGAVRFRIRVETLGAVHFRTRGQRSSPMGAASPLGLLRWPRPEKFEATGAGQRSIPTGENLGGRDVVTDPPPHLLALNELRRFGIPPDPRRRPFLHARWRRPWGCFSRRAASLADRDPKNRREGFRQAKQPVGGGGQHQGQRSSSTGGAAAATAANARHYPARGHPIASSIDFARAAAPSRPIKSEARAAEETCRGSMCRVRNGKSGRAK